MGFSLLDTVVFVSYFLVIAAVAFIAGRREREAADYFLAGVAVVFLSGLFGSGATARAAVVEAHQEAAAVALAAQDRLFNVLSLGVVVLTVAL